MNSKKNMHWYNNIKKKVGREPKNSTELLQGILENSNSHLGNAFQTWKIHRRWAEIVGKNIAANSRPKNYHKGTLYIAVKNSVWLQELSFMSGPIKDKVNRAAGWKWIEKVIFTLENNVGSKAGQNAPGSHDSPSK